MQGQTIMQIIDQEQWVKKEKIIFKINFYYIKNNYF